MSDLSTTKIMPHEDKAEDLAKKIRDAVRTRVLKPGDRLPTERALADDHQMSRGAVRNALALLDAEGLVDRRLGSGTFVHARAGDRVDAGLISDLIGPLSQIADDISPIDLIDVRMILEPAVAKTAALNGTPSDFRALRDVLEKLLAAGSDREAFSHWDQRFHDALAEATRNPLLVWLYKQMAEIRERAAWRAVQDKKLTGTRMSEYNDLHEQIVAALEARNGDLAAGIMTEHMVEARRDFLGA